MNSSTKPLISTHIIEKAKEFGASMCGIGNITSLKNSPSYKVFGKVEWPMSAKSVLVLGMAHKKCEPELDWWDDKEGKTPGNRLMISIAKSLKQWLSEEFNINAQPLPYHVEKGGIFLKDAAVLAGLGIIGKNNLLITPEFGPCVRLRALFLDVDFEPTGLKDFNPCQGCNMSCIDICPQQAFKNGFYSEILCNIQMKEDERNKLLFKKSDNSNLPSMCVKYCRVCELTCPLTK